MVYLRFILWIIIASGPTIVHNFTRMRVADLGGVYGELVGLVDGYSQVTIKCNCSKSADSETVGRIRLPDGRDYVINATNQKLVLGISEKILLGRYVCHCTEPEAVTRAVQLPYRLCTLDEHLLMMQTCDRIGIETTFCVMRPDDKPFTDATQQERKELCESMKLKIEDCQILDTSSPSFRVMCAGFMQSSDCVYFVRLSDQGIRPLMEEMNNTGSFLVGVTEHVSSCSDTLDLDLYVFVVEIPESGHYRHAKNRRRVFYGQRILVSASKNDSLYVVRRVYGKIDYQYCESAPSASCSAPQRTSDRTLVPIFRPLAPLSFGTLNIFLRNRNSRQFRFYFHMSYVVQDAHITVGTDRPCGKVRAILCTVRAPFNANVKIDRIKWIHNGKTIALEKTKLISTLNIDKHGDYSCEVTILFGLYNPPIVEKSLQTRSLNIPENCVAGSDEIPKNVYQHILIGVAVISIALLLIAACGIVYERRKRAEFSRTTGGTPDKTVSISPMTAAPQVVKLLRQKKSTSSGTGTFSFDKKKSIALIPQVFIIKKTESKKSKKKESKKSTKTNSKKSKKSESKKSKKTMPKKFKPMTQGMDVSLRSKSLGSKMASASSVLLQSIGGKKSSKINI